MATYKLPPRPADYDRSPISVYTPDFRRFTKLRGELELSVPAMFKLLVTIGEQSDFEESGPVGGDEEDEK